MSYIAFALFIAALLSVLMGLPGLPVVLIVASVAMARASLALLARRGEAPGARRWLIYPPLIVFYAFMAIVIVAWPLPIVGSGDIAIRRWIATLTHDHVALFGLVLTVLALGVWWCVV